MISNNKCELIKLTHIKHPFDPIFDNNSLVLILGSFPSVKSREYNFYYSHPQNRFWRVMTYITDYYIDNIKFLTIKNKINMLLKNKIALWDVIESCDISGSSDKNIRNVKPVDLFNIVNKTKIYKIYANGAKAYDLYMKYCYNKINIEIIKLPSTSSANAAYSFEKLIKKWIEIKDFL